MKGLPTRCIDPVMKCCQDCAWGYREYGDDVECSADQQAVALKVVVHSVLTKADLRTSRQMKNCKSLMNGWKAIGRRMKNVSKNKLT